jgi:hypothetical protein
MSAYSIADLPQQLAGKLHVDDNGCWIWTGALSVGYGHYQPSGTKKRKLVHRGVYELLVGPIPPRFDCDHLCRVPACCNPEHIEPVTHRENIRRGYAVWQGPTHCPSGHPYSGANLATHTYLSGPKQGRQDRRCKACVSARYYALKARRAAEAVSA